MTSDRSNYVAVDAYREDDARHWFVLQLTVLNNDQGESTYDFDSAYQCDIVSLDDDSSDYTSENWESGIFSGIRYALDSRCDVRVVIHTFRGCLGGRDLRDFAIIASNLVARHLETNRLWPITGWVIKEETLMNPS